MSAPMSRRVPGAGAGAGRADLFLHAALSRRTARVNALHFQRLKDKLGNRSNASSEVEFDDAYALRVGEEGAGIRTILQMVQLTRLDCAISSAGMMRAALAQALHHCAAPQRVSEAARRPADDARGAGRHGARGRGRGRAGDAALPLVRSGARRSPAEAARARLLTPAVKYWVCKTAPALRLRGDGVPRRQRLRRGGRAGAALSRGAGQRDLGRLRQRHGARRAARASSRDGEARARDAGRACAARRSGLPGAAEAVAFIGEGALRATPPRRRPAPRSSGSRCWPRPRRWRPACAGNRRHICAHAVRRAARCQLRHRGARCGGDKTPAERVLPDS